MNLEKRKYDFGFTVSSLGSYTDQVSDQLLMEAIAGGNTAQWVTVLPNVKYKKALNFLGGVIDVEARACGSTAGSSTTVFTQKTLEVVSFQVKEELCVEDLVTKWTAMKMAPGSKNDQLPFEQAIAEFKTKQIQDNLEKTYWIGDNTGSGTYPLFDGYYTILSGDTNRVKSTYSGVTITASNAIDVIDDMIVKIPNEIADKGLVGFCGYNVFKLIVQAWRNENYYSYNVDGMENWVFQVPGTTVKIVATHGLDGTNHVILTTPENLYIGTDVEDEYNQFKLMYVDYHDLIMFRAYGKIGVQIAFPAYCVCNF